jgi:8-oxo-dGTP pyrophosphatase MutT (NUDIX family)
MEMGRPAPGETINEGPETVPRPAATVILLRGGADALELLLVQRNPESRFMGGAWVFPGGAVDRGEGEGDAALRAAAIREVAEEAGVTLPGPDELVPFSRWITPAKLEIRFDTWFYLALMPAGVEPRVDGAEIVDARWYAPRAALDASADDELFLVFPTIKHLEQLAGFRSAQELLEYARGREVLPVEPRVVVQGDGARVVLPGEPGYDAE